MVALESCLYLRTPGDVLFVSSISRKLEAPMERAEERKHHRAVSGLEIQGLVKQGDCHAGVDVRDET